MFFRHKTHDKLPCILIGTSGWGSNYLKRLSRSKQFKITLVVDVDKKQLFKIKHRYGYETSISLETALASNSKVVFLTLPNHLHFYFAKRLLESGKHVYVEKPLCNTPEEANELKKIAEDNNVVLYTCHNFSYEPSMIRLEQELKSSSLGRIFDIEIERSLPTAYSIKKTDWRNNSEYCPYGPLMQLGIHYIDYLNEIFGSFKIMIRDIECYVADNTDYFYAQVKYSKTRLRMKFSYISNNTNKILINAENYNLFFNGKLLYKISHSGKKKRLPLPKNDSLQQSISEFHSFIATNNILSNTQRAIQSIELIYRLGQYESNT